MLQGPCGSETIGERVLSRLPPPGHCTDKGLKHTPSLPMKKAHLLYLEFQPEGQTSGYHTFRSYESALRECRPRAPSLCSPLTLLQFTVTFQNGAYRLIWSPNFHICHTRDTYRSTSLEASRVYNCCLIGLYKLA